jgi:hypothetical protein
MAPLGASSITTALERFRYNNFNAGLHWIIVNVAPMSKIWLSYD